MSQTKSTNLVNPEVMAASISASLPKRIKFSKIAKVDTTLVGQPGNTITVPKFAYIGDAEDVAEGVAIGTTTLTASTTTVTVKKAGKAIEITDEAANSGYGDPVGEGENQLKLAISAKVDNDCVASLLKATLNYFPATLSVIGYNGVVDAQSKFDSDTDDALDQIVFINPAQEATIKKDPNFMDKNKYPLDVIMNGTIGKIGNAQVVKSKKVPLIKYEVCESSAEEGAKKVVASNASTGEVNQSAVTGCTWDATNKAVITPAANTYVVAVANDYYLNPIVIVDTQDPNTDPATDAQEEDMPALTIYLKADVQVEADRDILKKTTVISADEHYTTALSNDSKVVLAKFKA